MMIHLFIAHREEKDGEDGEGEREITRGEER